MDAIQARGLIVEALDQVTGARNLAEFAPALADPLADVRFDALGLDSLTGIEFCFAMEERVGVELELSDLLKHDSVNRLAAFIADALTSRDDR